MPISDPSPEDMGEVARKQELGVLKDRQRRLLATQRMTNGAFRNYKVTAVLFAAVGITLLCFQKGVATLFGITSLAFTCLVFAATVAESAKRREIETELGRIDFQIDLLHNQLTERELRAEKLLWLHDFQLRRYYELNLTQNRSVFTLGVGCIGIGVLVIGATMYVLVSKQDQPLDIHTKIITAVLGGAGAILTNFVAALYLKMHAAASQNLASFHSRLVATHQLMLGNLLASRIGNDDKRWETLSALALKMAPTKE